MYFVMTNQTVVAVGIKPSDVFDILNSFENQYKALSKGSTYSREIQQHYKGDLDTWLGSRMKNYSVVKANSDMVMSTNSNLGYALLTYDYNALNKSGGKGCYVAGKGCEIVTEDFLEFQESKYISSTVVRADVVKKGLKSTGKTVTVNDLAGVKSNDPGVYKEAADKMLRVNVIVNGWGTVGMSPDSLDNYRIEHNYNTLWTAKVRSE